jgi:NADH-quinone oxidoreductase subunit N
MLTGLAPELVLVVGGVLVVLVGLSKTKWLAESVTEIALAAIAAALFAAWRLGHADVEPVAQLTGDPLVWYTRLVGLAVGVLILLANRHVPAERERGEFFALLLFSLAGVLLVASANNLVLLFLALELVSVPTYIMIGLSRRDIRAQEATGKYFFLGAFAAAITLYGFSFLYGAAGTMQLFQTAGSSGSIYAMLSEPGALADTTVILGLLLSLAGLAFKIAAVPFHFYVADVYQGAASPVTGMLGFVPKFAGFIAIIRILSLSGWSYAQESTATNDALFWLLWVLAAATMFAGNTLALMQHNVKRMLAYSSIAHSGTMLVALVAGPGTWAAADATPLRNGLTAVLFYMAVYGVMNLGAFAALSYFRTVGQEGEEDSAETLDDLAGAARRHPWAGLALAICVLGLMGFPLTGGFLGKLYVFSAALSASEGTAGHRAMIVLVVIGVVNSAIAAAYYLRILAACYLRKPAEGVSPNRCAALRLAMALCAVIVLAVFFRPGVLFDASSSAVARIRAIPPRRLSQTTPDAEPAAGSTGAGSLSRPRNGR